MKVRLLLVLLSGIYAVAAQSLEPQALLNPPTNTWATYNGDYSGRRYSTLDQINTRNVASLKLAWAFQTHSTTFKATPLEVNGILYFTTPDNAWAVDARTGRQIWHYHRASEGNHLGNRGVAMYNDRLYMGTPDAHVICLNARDGKQIWDVTVADVAFGYYLSVAPLLVKNKIVIGTSGDQTDVPHFIEALSPDDGSVIWRFNTLPPSDTAEAKTWPNADSLAHGGGPAWVTGTYDPELNLVYWGTGNPHPVLAGIGRKGANLYTCAIVALDADSGKLKWYFQPSPHDTHDWDAVETPVLFDAEFKGRPRKLLAQASRNGYYFLLDRETGEDLVTTRFIPVDWASGLNAKGEPVSDPAKEPQRDGSLVRAYEEGATNWQAPSFDPQTKLLYVNAQDGFTIYYLDLSSSGKPEGHQGGLANPLWGCARLVAIDYETGKVRWTREEEEGFGHPGILTTAGGLLITGDVTGNLLALDAANGNVLWHVYPGGVLNSSPMTYEWGGKQFILTGVEDVVYAWTLPGNEEGK
ncbi:MAG: acido-empty-quinoprotein group A [Acidobacteriaceae bacterium]|nr:acido-empty-quinoprotein group A [Acidobacteriaceae bacterium]